MNQYSNDKSDDDAVVLDQVQELTWALLDDNASEDDVVRLQGLLNSSQSARQDYLQCVQLHVGLHDYFAAAPESEKPRATGKSPILGFLNAGALPLDMN